MTLKKKTKQTESGDDGQRMLPRLLIKFLIDLFIVNNPHPQSTVALTYPAFPSATRTWGPSQVPPACIPLLSLAPLSENPLPAASPLVLS